jgi:GT2 family glycosyltransferase
MEASLSSPIQLSVSIVLHNSSLELLRRTLRSLELSSSYASRKGSLASVSVSLIDNSTSNTYTNSVRSLISEFDQTEVSRFSYTALPSNEGFGSGNNRVISTAKTDCHLVLNPDVELSETALLYGLNRLREDSSIAVISPNVVGDHGEQELLCKRYPSVLVLLLRAFAPGFIRRMFHRRLEHFEMRDSCAGTEEVDVLLASGCCMLVRTATINAIDGFDERYFLYFEDFDLSLRIAGLGRVVYFPPMKIVHHGGYAASKGFMHVKLFIKSGVRFFNNHGWRWI